MRTLDEKNYSYYEKAVQRLKKCGTLDPTSVIAELEKEIDQYRDKIRCYEEDFRKKRKESYIKDALGKLWNQEYSFEIIKDSQDLDRECFNFFKSEFDKANLLEKKLIDCVNILQKEVREIKKGIYKNEK